MIKSDKDSYLDLKQLSEYSTFSDSTLRDYLSDPDTPIPYFRVKRKIIVRKTEFDRWMEQFRDENNELDRIVDEVMNDL
ncbi:helix-turn-helix domain-containing protein [Thermodesulfobacteriota bacterium]